MSAKEKWDGLPKEGLGLKKLRKLKHEIEVGITAGDVRCLRPDIDFKRCEEIVKDKVVKKSVEKAMRKAGNAKLDRILSSE